MNKSVKKTYTLENFNEHFVINCTDCTMRIYIDNL